MLPQDKLKKLRAILCQFRSVLLAFSGGVDSTFLLCVAAQTFGAKLLAVTAVSPAMTKPEAKQAALLTKRLKVRHKIISVVLPKEFWQNSPQRCYYCKKRLFLQLKEIARQHSINAVVDASNADDIKDYRPGAKALQELGIRSPLREAGLTKDEIRCLSRKMNLPTWEKPSLACLASRIPYGKQITPRKLAMIGKAEEFLHRQGFLQVRVRLHGQLARIEIPQEKMPTAFKLRQRISKKFKSLGLTYIALDLDGYRSGSMNEALLWKNGR